MVVSKTTTLGDVPTIYECDSNGRGNHTVVTDMDGTLLVGRSSFPYFALVAFDVGGIFRLFLLLLATPFVGFLYYLISEAIGIQLLIFVTFAGVKVSAIKSAASAVLPKHYSEDLHPETWRVFSSCGKKYMLTANPRIMVEPFLKNYLGVDVVLGTEIMSYKGIATGLVARPGVLVGNKKANALRRAFGVESMPHVGIGDRNTDLLFMKLCKEMYVVPSKPKVEPLKSDLLPKPVIFHDGRLVRKPTPLTTLLIVLWFPIGVVIGVLRLLIGSFSPISKGFKLINLIGCPIIVKGHPPRDTKQSPHARKGMILVCSHRTVLDPAFVSWCLGQTTTVLSYSVSSFVTDHLSPIKVAKLTRNRVKDAKLIQEILNEGRHLVIFPEGTTCREPYLLRFSSLFAELTDQIVPVAIVVKTSMFHGTTARGYKFLDPLFFAMNPRPRYEITFLNKLRDDQTSGFGKSSHDVANNVQEMIARVLNYQCTNLRRKDKYQVLVGTDGVIG